MSIRKLRAGRVPSVTASQYIGEKGTIFWDEGTGTLRLSDGETPGGYLLSVQTFTTDNVPEHPSTGNLWFDGLTGKLYIYFDNTWVDTNPVFVLPVATDTQLGGVKSGPGAVIAPDGTLSIDTSGLPLNIGDLAINGANISTINTNEDLSLVSNGTGNVNVYGNFKVYTDGLGSTVSFAADSTGLLTIHAPNPVPTGSSGALNIIGSSDGSYQNVTGPGGMLHITGNNDTLARVTIDGFLTAATGPQTALGAAAGYGTISMRTARGTPTSPLPVQANDLIGNYSALGWVASSGRYSPNQVAGLQFFAAETFTSSAATGTYAQFRLAPVGSNAGVVAATIRSTGIVTGKLGSTDTTNSTSSTTGAVTTAGGLGVAKDAYFGQSVWVDSELYTSYVGSTGNGSTLTLQGGSDAQGAVSVNSDLFSVTTTSLTTPALQTDGLGHTTFTDLDPGSIAPTVVITGNTDSSTQEPNTNGVQLHITGGVGNPGRIYNDGQGSYATIVNRRYNGTSTSPTAVLDTQIIGRVGATPYTSDGWPTISTARIDFVATEDQTGTDQGNAIQFYTIPNGSVTPQLTLQVASTGVVSYANLLPYTDNTYDLGSSSNRWKDIYIGPGTLYITDQTLLTTAAVTVNNGVFNIDGVAQAQLPTILATTISAQSTSDTLNIGQAGDTGTLQLHRPITFSDATVQSTAGIPLTQKGAANGVATLDSSGKVSSSQIPPGGVVYQGTWSASANSPALADGTGTAGYEYAVTTSGTVDFGHGNITFAAGDYVIYGSNNQWQRIPTGGLGVTSINTTLTGAVTGIVTTSDTGTVTNTMLAGSIANNKLSNSSITTTAGTGITLGGSSVSLGGTLTITNAGVTSNVAGTGISVSGSTGAVTITNTGVTAASAGSGISVSSSTGSVTFTNTGVLSNLAGTHITVSSGTGNVTIGTDATSLNTASTIVARDSSGNFAAGTITGNITGNAGTVTNGVYTSGSYSDPTWLTISKSKVGLGNVENTALSTSTYYIGTTQNTYGRASGAQTLSGVSISGNAGTVTNGVYTTDTGTVTNTMLAGSIANNKLSNSTITINSTAVSLGGSITGIVTTSDTGTVTNTMLAGSIANNKLSNSTISGVALGGTLNALTAGYGLALESGGTYDGSAAHTINNYHSVSTPTVTGAGANGWTASIDLGTTGGIVIVGAGGNFSGTITITGTPVVGKVVRVLVTGGIKGATVVTVSGLTAANSSNGLNTFAATSGTASTVNVEFLCTTTALSGVYMTLPGAK
jgi:hypothetical protein